MCDARERFGVVVFDRLWGVGVAIRTREAGGLIAVRIRGRGRGRAGGWLSLAGKAWARGGGRCCLPRAGVAHAWQGQAGADWVVSLGRGVVVWGLGVLRKSGSY